MSEFGICRAALNARKARLQFQQAEGEFANGNSRVTQDELKALEEKAQAFEDILDLELAMEYGPAWDLRAT